MPENSARLNIPLPLGNETVSRQAIRTMFQAVDDNAETPAGAQTKAEAAADVVGDALALHMADYAHQFAVDIGVTNAYVVTRNPVPAALVAGQMLQFIATHANTGASTLNDSALGVKTIKKNVTSDLVAGDIKLNQIVTVMYDGTYYQLIPMNAVDPALLTTQGDIPYASGVSTWTRLAKGSANQILKMNASGTVPEWGNAGGEAVSVTKSTSQSIPSLTQAILTFDTELFDTSNMHDNSTNNSRLVAPVTGKYLVICQLYWVIFGTDKYSNITLFKNGAYTKYTTQIRSYETTGNGLAHNLVALLSLNANDYLEMSVSQGTGSAQNANADYTMFSMIRVG
ncbi:hypothetical protein [Dehalobacter sp. TeCB1]|uniref:hypothetical protein n=1 Tax=Dehalobacter sp. TeCB1 TaxID=1843715 RepID=UPI00083B4EF7|nr:hypothetical protein [Dehalobacter sp. TeCB1]OCZ53784.1 hypothetical protein A7D23_07430 [Dehalobacter sp. TeCB1]